MSIPAGFSKLELAPAGFVDLNGPLFGKWEDDRIVIGLEVEHRHCNAVGTCHGGMLAFFADMMLAMGSSLQAGLHRFLPTINLSCDFIEPATLGMWIEGRINVLSITRTMVFSRGEITNNGTILLRANGILKLRNNSA